MYQTIILILCCFSLICSLPVPSSENPRTKNCQNNGHANSTCNTSSTNFEENNPNLPNKINSLYQGNQSLTSGSNNSHEELIGQQKGLGNEQDLGSGMEPAHDQGLGSRMGPIIDQKNQNRSSGMGSSLTGHDDGLGSGSGPVEQDKESGLGTGMEPGHAQGLGSRMGPIFIGQKKQDQGSGTGSSSTGHDGSGPLEQDEGSGLGRDQKTQQVSNYSYL